MSIPSTHVPDVSKIAINFDMSILPTCCPNVSETGIIFDISSRFLQDLKECGVAEQLFPSGFF